MRQGLGFWRVTLIVGSLFAGPAARAVVSGVVRNSGSNHCVPGAIVSVQATDMRTVTDANGRFSLDVSNDADGDRVTDLDDFPLLRICLIGPDHDATDIRCTVLNDNRDGRLDLLDFAGFQHAFGAQP